MSLHPFTPDQCFCPSVCLMMCSVRLSIFTVLVNVCLYNVYMNICLSFMHKELQRLCVQLMFSTGAFAPIKACVCICVWF